MTRITRFCSSLLVIMGFAVMTAANAQELHIDPQKVTGPDACGECHESSVKAWKESHHAKTFHELPRSDESREIAKKMGIKRIKAESDCLSCHFTSAIRRASQSRSQASVVKVVTAQARATSRFTVILAARMRPRKQKHQSIGSSDGRMPRRPA